MWDKSLVEDQVVEFKPYRIDWILFLHQSVFAGENATESGAKNSLFKHGPYLNIMSLSYFKVHHRLVSTARGVVE